MRNVQHTTRLRRVLFADALLSGVTGVLLLGGAAILASVLGLPAPLLRWAGLALVPFAVVVLAVGRREQPARWAVWGVVGANALWVLGSIGLLLSGEVTPTWMGYGVVLLQAVVVGVIAELQVLALGRTTLQTV